MSTVIEIVREIEKLSPVEQSKIVSTIMHDVINPDKDIEKIWADESSNRWIEYKKGIISTVSYREAMSRYK